MPKKSILLTGINGYLGSHLAIALRKEYQIIGLEINLNNLFRLKDLNFKVYEASKKGIENAFQKNKIDGIIHTATFYGRQNEAIRTLAKANLFIPFDILDLAISSGCRFFINTDTVLDRFVSTYALTKRHFHEWLYLRRNEIKIANMQLEHFFGPGCSNTNFITAMIERLKRNDKSIDLTAGEQCRNFVYIDDVVSAYQTVLNKLDDEKKVYSDYQVATAELISIREIMVFMKEHTKSSSLLNFGAIPYRENELMKSRTDNSVLIEMGWTPKNSIREGLIKTING